MPKKFLDGEHLLPGRELATVPPMVQVGFVGPDRFGKLNLATASLVAPGSDTFK
jgi:hypothetical protein